MPVSMLLNLFVTGILFLLIILLKKRSEGKHYNVAVSHAAQKLVRLIFALEKSGQPYKV